MTADELRQAHAFPLRLAEPPAPAVVAFAAEHGLSAFPEQPSSAPGGPIARQEPTRTLAVGKLVTELPVPAAIAPAAAGVLSAFQAGGGTNAEELRRAQAFLLQVAKPPALAVVVSVAWRLLVAFQERAVEPLGSAGSAFADGYGPVQVPALRKGVAA
ncbi:hypothetical protein ILP97_45415 [Amycolatopsis sp. H6(2020)]|nr:hypothetical protein [Amycolatopsis sp. H6(2020)]